MPLYESETITREELEKKRQYNVCTECGGWLNLLWDSEKKLAFIACADYSRTHHEGIARENNELREKNIPTRRKEVKDKFGQEKERALAKYQMAGIINRDAAEEIVETLWKGASPVDKTKAIILCATYNLNPLMNHLFMLPFQNKKTGKTDYAVVIGIEATRLMAHRKHKFTYLDLTPRKATADELEKILGKENIKPNTLYVITKGKDLETGAEGHGLGSWSGPVYGEDKGNSAFNMASIRSERQFFKRMYPAEQPAGVDVVDERFVEAIEGEYNEVEVDTTTGEIRDTRGEYEKEGRDLLKEITEKKPEPRAKPKEQPQTKGEYAESLQYQAKKTAVAEPEGKREQGVTAPEQAQAPSKPELSPIDLPWLKEALNTLQWTDVGKYLKDTYGVTGERVSQQVKLLTPDQAKDFTAEVERRIKEQGGE